MSIVNQDANSLLASTPMIPEIVYQGLPKLLKQTTSHFDGRIKDVVLTSCLSVISGCIDNVKGRYSMEELHPNLFAMIVAPAANGKGNAKFAKVLGRAVHEHLKQIVKPNTTQPALGFSLFIPANTSSARLYQHLHANGGRGILFETEIDTLGKTFKQEWGDYSDVLRASFHHEDVGYSRKEQSGSYMEIVSPRISVFLSGTLNQAISMLPSAENGLCSRFLFYLFEADVKWQSVEPTEDNFKQVFTDYGNELLEIVKYFEEHPCQYVLTEEQWNKFNEFFSSNLKLYNERFGTDTNSTIKRMGVICFRICMLLSCLRRWDKKETGDTLVCVDEDFENAISLTEVYMQHAVAILKLIPYSELSKRQTGKALFFEKLPSQFERKDAIDIAEQTHIGGRSGDRYLAELVKEGKISKSAHGIYEKIS